ncbi:hypothetical protein ACIGCZ_37995 [Streptomyces nigra]|uniref:hypothetical protein n=1 Tax=Streptomyces nigra TaxID=1827580 RepID=UPI0037CD8C1B
MGTGRLRVPAGAMNWGIAVSVAVLLLGTGLSGQHPGGERGLFGAVLLAVGGLAPAARRRAALAVPAVTGVCAVGYEAAGFEVLASPTWMRCTARCGPGTVP